MASIQSASTSRQVLAYAREDAYNELPAVRDGKLLQYTGESLGFTQTKQASQNINAYRGPTSQEVVDASVAGAINIEMAYAMYDELIAAALMGNWVEFGVNGMGAAVGSLTAAPGTLTADAPTAGASAFSLLKPGQFFTLANAGPLNSNKLFRVHPTTAPTDTVITLDPSTPASAGAFANATLSVARLRNGFETPSFIFEKNNSDVNEYTAYTGVMVNTFTLSMQNGSLLTGTFGLMGANALKGQQLTGTLVDSPDYPSMSAVSSKNCQILVNGLPLEGTMAQSLSMSYSNTLREQKGLCVRGNVGMGVGSIALTIDLTVYFASGNLFYDEFLDNENFEFTFVISDKSGYGYAFTLTRANVATHTVNAGAKDQDLLATMQLTGLINIGAGLPADLNGAALIIDRFGPAVNL